MFGVLFALAALPAAAPCHLPPPAGGPIVCCSAACPADTTTKASFLIKVIDLSPDPKSSAPKLRAKPKVPAPPKPAAPAEQSTASPKLSPACTPLDKSLTSSGPNPAAPSQDDANQPKAIEADSVIALLGNPSPLTLTPRGSKILVYSSTLDLKLYSPALKQLEAAIKMLPALEAKPKPTRSMRTIEIPVPSSAKADTFANLDGKFKVTLEYPGMLQVAETSTVSCAEWLAMLDSIESSSIGRTKQSPVSRLFYLQSAEKTASAILGAETGSGAGSPSAGDAQGKSDDESSAPAAKGGASDESASSTQDASDSSTAGSSAKKDSKTPPASPAPTAKPGQSSSNQPAKTPSKDAGAAGQNLSVQSLEQDMLIFGGDDEKIRAAKRVLAMLDLPRPEMIINAWVLQMSTNNANQVGEFDSIARRFVAQNNDVLQRGIQAGWLSLRGSIDAGAYFDPDFYTYLTSRYIADLTQQPAGENEVANRASRGVCPRGQYCLGYTTLFNPLKPRLTDLLLAMIASQDRAANLAAIDAAENVPDDGEAATGGRCASAQCDELRQRLGLNVPGCKNNCESRNGSNETAVNSTHPSACGAKDLERLIDSAGDQFLAGKPPQLQLECFRQAIKDMTLSPDNKVPPAQALARAAVADFLFHYKTSQQYPSEFSTYDLALSADAFNSALSPFTDAFNRDIAAYQEYLNNVVSMAEDGKANRNVAFTNSGLVSVRTVSSNRAKVSSTTQSFLDASSFPDLATLANNISGAASGSGQSAVSGVLAHLSPDELQVLMGALKSFQSSQAQIGRAIDLNVSPRSLNGASSAEMDITLNVDEQGTPTRYTGTSSDKFNLSRVATHDTVTHVRVDSLKLFEVSAIGAKLTLSRPPIPLILPGVELPYIGSIVGLPRKPAEEYHSSVAIMSAIVVPTAADLAYGLRFDDDRIVVSPPGLCLRPWESWATGSLPYCKTGEAASEIQLEGSIQAFHRVKKECIATGGQDSYGLMPGTGPKSNLCGALTFDLLPAVFSPR
jgi:hypothetical protein